ncbi:hypothetical protein INR49_001957 [Caranx melampygus]|nr:hypothetical protein INR49_001957 [Caranx melampygus]
MTKDQQDFMQPSHFHPTFERRFSPACVRLAQPPTDSLVISTAPTLTENEESHFEKGTKRE